MRSHLISALEFAVRRPLMYGGDGNGVYVVLYHMLHYLAFIDEREDELKLALEELQTRRVSISTGIVGAFRNRIRGEFDFGTEVASVLAELAFHLDLVTLDRVLTAAERKRMLRGLWTAVKSRNWNADDIQAAFGQPSLNIRTVFAYATENREEPWIFFDFVETREDLAPGKFYQFKLRNARLPSDSFAGGLVFTPWGQQYKR